VAWSNVAILAKPMAKLGDDFSGAPERVSGNAKLAAQ